MNLLKIVKELLHYLGVTFEVSLFWCLFFSFSYRKKSFGFLRHLAYTYSKIAVIPLVFSTIFFVTFILWYFKLMSFSLSFRKKHKPIKPSVSTNLFQRFGQNAGDVSPVQLRFLQLISGQRSKLTADKRLHLRILFLNRFGSSEVFISFHLEM